MREKSVADGKQAEIPVLVNQLMEGQSRLNTPLIGLG
ncbi:Hypothetical Protein SLY_1107 [Strawberry lethal yellows phytoplasma (CPA) str. NZSb11]|uniref:Uncharacterized protein n=1 Tax=Strawberry lethal yellows phytoplasma (CPA) str. NZSb11 TaxID=980422 RepID=R4RWZ9_PHYAS|nr:Hypothetical Protein SLY_0487 [Strawberry lethal yellows phytoplasma (CPA) str. NZSb11]AGL91013.1 Hypothetical Protein SLY_1107 [Strawberry lethal yellows phytoplasma (CPA) str. NZSb11]